MESICHHLAAPGDARPGAGTSQCSCQSWDNSPAGGTSWGWSPLPPVLLKGLDPAVICLETAPGVVGSTCRLVPCIAEKPQGSRMGGGSVSERRPGRPIRSEHWARRLWCLGTCAWVTHSTEVRGSGDSHWQDGQALGPVLGTWRALGITGQVLSRPGR